MKCAFQVEPRAYLIGTVCPPSVWFGFRVNNYFLLFILLLLPFAPPLPVRSRDIMNIFRLLGESL